MMSYVALTCMVRKVAVRYWPAPRLWLQRCLRFVSDSYPAHSDLIADTTI